MAKRRLADEYDAAQERGEVAGHGGGKSNLGKPKVNEIGLSYDQLHEARQIRDAEAAHPTIARETLAAGGAVRYGCDQTKAWT